MTSTFRASVRAISGNGGWLRHAQSVGSSRFVLQRARVQVTSRG